MSELQIGSRGFKRKVEQLSQENATLILALDRARQEIDELSKKQKKLVPS